MKLHQQRIKFTELLGKLLTYATSLKLNIAIDESRVFYKRQVLIKASGFIIEVEDRVHKKNSKHYDGLAVDLLLYNNNGEYIKDALPYRPLGEYWESLGGRWGGRYANRDANHFEL